MVKKWDGEKERFRRKRNSRDGRSSGARMPSCYSYPVKLVQPDLEVMPHYVALLASGLGFGVSSLAGANSIVLPKSYDVPAERVKHETGQRL